MNIIDKFIEKHGDKYDYSFVEYVNSKTDVVIVCYEHGQFLQRPDHHIQGKGCYKCMKGGRLFDLKYTISQFEEIHGQKYDYSQSEYINANTDIKIICKFHQIPFYQIVADHKRGYGCPLCVGRKPKNLSKLEVLTQIYGGIYSGFSPDVVDTAKTNTPIDYICSIHGPQRETIAQIYKHGCGFHTE